MKASSVGVEFFVKLSEEEIEALGKIGLKGEVKVRNKKPLGNFPLELKVGEIDKNQLYIEYRTIPFNVYFEDAAGFVFLLSKEGYEMLKERKTTADRMYKSPECTIKICSEDYNKED